MKQKEPKNLMSVCPVDQDPCPVDRVLAGRSGDTVTAGATFVFFSFGSSLASCFFNIVWQPGFVICMVVSDTNMQVILSSPYGPQVFYFLLWLIDF